MISFCVCARVVATGSSKSTSSSFKDLFHFPLSLSRAKEERLIVLFSTLDWFSGERPRYEKLCRTRVPSILASPPSLLLCWNHLPRQKSSKNFYPLFHLPMHGTTFRVDVRQCQMISKRKASDSMKKIVMVCMCACFRIVSFSNRPCESVYPSPPHLFRQFVLKFIIGNNRSSLKAPRYDFISSNLLSRQKAYVSLQPKR